jgi:phospholipid/cholesterol/gamma-HCH transport system ATP-binding protein
MNESNKYKTVIDVEHLYKSFDDNIVLNDINLTLKKGQNLVVLGKSGVGKSVLIRCLVRLDWPDSGIIKVFGINILEVAEYELNKIRRKIGYLFQGGALYDSMTLKENLLFPLKRSMKNYTENEYDDLVDEVLESVGLLDVKDKVPSELSGGMKKRAGLARTLVLKPEIILYDEPTSGLDPFTSEDISELIVSIKEKFNNSSVIVTHDMKCAKKTADRILVMEGGKFISEGNYNDLKNTKWMI